jgi:hypothetical protein
VKPGRKKAVHVKGAAVPPGVADSIAALALSGTKSKAELAREFGVNIKTVDRIVNVIKGLDAERVREIQAGLPSLLTVLAGLHTIVAIENARDDPALSVKSSFGAKLAIEAGRIAEPQAASPGSTMFNFIRNLQVNVGESHALPDQPQPERLLVAAPAVGTGSALPSGPDDAGHGAGPGPGLGPGDGPESGDGWAPPHLGGEWGDAPSLPPDFGGGWGPSGSDGPDDAGTGTQLDAIESVGEGSLGLLEGGGV